MNIKRHTLKLSRDYGPNLMIKAGICAWIKDWWARSKGRRLYGNMLCILSLLLLLVGSSVSLYLNYRSDKQTTAPLRVSVSVLQRQNLEILFQAPEVAVNEEDLSRGYVEMVAATRLSIYNNDKNGNLLHFSAIRPPFEKALVSGLGNEVQVGVTDAFVHQEYKKGTITRTLNYKFYLSGDARPGNYAWPLTITLDEAEPRFISNR